MIPHRPMSTGHALEAQGAGGGAETKEVLRRGKVLWQKCNAFTWNSFSVWTCVCPVCADSGLDTCTLGFATQVGLLIL